MNANRLLIPLTSASEKGDGIVNEDVLGWNQWRAWVIDGGSDIAETVRPVPSLTGARWISSALSDALSAASLDQDVGSILSEFALMVRRSVTSADWGPASVPPICSVAVVERRGLQLIVSTVGDVAVYVPSRECEISDARFGSNEKRGVAHDQKSSESTIAQRREQYLSGRNGMWVVGNNPSVSEGVYETLIEAAEPIDVMIASDGFARAIHPYGLFSGWLELFQAVVTEGSCAVLERIRRFEAESRSDGSHYKKRDDASVLVVRM